MRIAMIGTGYVGLVTGACFADFGHRVVCVDTDPEKIKTLNRGELPIYEPDLAEMVAANVREHRLSFGLVPSAAVRDVDAVFIAVGTPSRRGDGCADLSYVYAAAADIAPALPRSAIVVVKSTVPVGTGDEVERIIRALRPKVAVVSNPEFLRAGAAIHDFKHPDRIVIGTDDARAREIMGEIYRPLSLDAAPIIYTGRRTAELVKYAANAFLATKITFINEIADLCEKIGADVQDVARGIGLDNRIGPKFLHAGPGFGGSCFPKDASALVKIGQDHEAPLRIVETVLAVNDARKRAMARKVAAMLGGSLRGRTIALLGLTFKPNTDDMREAPSLTLAASLADMGARIRAYDPVANQLAQRLMPHATYCESAYHAAEGADALVVVTEWEQFRALDLKRLRRIMATPVIVDLRNVYRSEEVVRHGFAYHRVGSPPQRCLTAPARRRAANGNGRAHPARANGHGNGTAASPNGRRRQRAHPRPAPADVPS